MFRTYSSRYSRITVLSLRAVGGIVLLNLRPGTSPFGETSRSSAGFLYGSTSSIMVTIDQYQTRSMTSSIEAHSTSAKS